MNLFENINISLNKKELISIIGGGGKTTTMFRLADELSKHNKKVLVTTTTAILKPKEDKYEKLIILEEGNTLNDVPKSGVTVLLKEIIKENKYKGIDEEMVNEIYSSNIFDYIIVEADGANMKPLKAPASHEPVIPGYTTKTICVVGMDCLGKKIYKENVHRPEIITKLTNSKLGDTITSDIIYEIIVASEGMFKNTPLKSDRYLILNKAESKERVQAALEVKDKLIKNKFDIDEVIIGSMRGD
ncbi:putative selenium-dependent hydroxylase accessory protein [Gottschalkia acidurici 9a]|uniref:Selenium-dependent hydroxylase accessory protein n=1 Tax=Gottschalkia acidurici (strain ATCC 7906 / DSM 604 / BCRC 14475 / CIP 104303 / KCTC 5404 / NCIMB 10678 / 9a) TaxID=1128398 RepID=K0B422_GOTA9|nr:selenium cofactor biosynthesis protein YqeC [Gottschalkia acidurici]AFS79867.1 putative selenium-dependent hydroxylase accessory protein [Gottschalkia acidurici 9a]